MKYHSIDNYLVKQFLLKNPNISESIKSSLIDWHLALNRGDENDTREKALDFIKILTAKHIGLLNADPDFATEVIEIFDPLEKLLKIAISIKKNIRIRDHLNHTLRNVLFADYLIHIRNNEDIDENDIGKLALSTIFHDFAYPIQKIKDVAHNIIKGTLGTFLNSQGKISISIEDPDNLLTLLDYYGSLSKNNDSFGLETKKGIDKLYKLILFPAIAGKGLFEAPHCISSCVLLLNLVQKLTLTEHKLKNLLEICFAIAYHDRERNMNELESITTSIAFLRIADELQEWDRDQIEFSFIDDVKVENESGLYLSFFMKNRFIKGTIELCDPNITLKDKIIGIFPVRNHLPIILEFNFPIEFDKNTFLKKYKDISDMVSFESSLNTGKKVTLSFKEKVIINIEK